MFFLKLVARNVFRARLRSTLTIVGLVIAVLAFGLLQTVVRAWYAGSDAASATRLIARNAISLTFSMPVYYREKIRAVPGVTGVSVSNWFGGVYKEPKNFFAQFAVAAQTYFPMYPEYVFDPDEYAAFLRDRRGAVVGRQLADLYGFQVGDRLPLRGTIYPGNHEFTIRAIYDGRDPGTITRQLYFHYDYLNEYLKQRFPRGANNVGVFVVDVNDPARVADVAQAIDAEFANSLAETLTETEKAFQLSFVAMVETIVQVISGVSYIVIAIILAFAFLFAKTNLRKYAFAIGGNPVAARLSEVWYMVPVALMGAAFPVLWQRRSWLMLWAGWLKFGSRRASIRSSF